MLVWSCSSSGLQASHIANSANLFLYSLDSSKQTLRQRFGYFIWESAPREYGEGGSPVKDALMSRLLLGQLGLNLGDPR